MDQNRKDVKPAGRNPRHWLHKDGKFAYAAKPMSESALTTWLKGTSLTFRIVTGLVLGIVCGLFFGEKAKVHPWPLVYRPVYRSFLHLHKVQTQGNTCIAGEYLIKFLGKRFARQDERYDDQ
jgi:hypothetical protein